MKKMFLIFACLFGTVVSASSSEKRQEMDDLYGTYTALKESYELGDPELYGGKLAYYKRRSQIISSYSPKKAPQELEGFERREVKVGEYLAMIEFKMREFMLTAMHDLDQRKVLTTLEAHSDLFFDSAYVFSVTFEVGSGSRSSKKVYIIAAEREEDFAFFEEALAEYRVLREVAESDFDQRHREHEANAESEGADLFDYSDDEDEVMQREIVKGIQALKDDGYSYFGPLYYEQSALLHNNTPGEPSLFTCKINAYKEGWESKIVCNVAEDKRFPVRAIVTDYNDSNPTSGPTEESLDSYKEYKEAIEGAMKELKDAGLTDFSLLTLTEYGLNAGLIPKEDQPHSKSEGIYQISASAYNPTEKRRETVLVAIFKDPRSFGGPDRNKFYAKLETVVNIYNEEHPSDFGGDLITGKSNLGEFTEEAQELL